MKPVLRPEQLYPVDDNLGDGHPAGTDRINPDYYKGAIECIDVIEQLDASFCIGNVIKYVWRWKGKNGIEDLRKARWYLDRAIEEAENGTRNVQDSTM